MTTNYHTFATGNSSQANGWASAAFGYLTLANGGLSFATGDNTKAIGELSTAMGYSTKAKPFASFVIGQYNDTTGAQTIWWSGTDPAFVIGNGSGESARSNAFTVLQNGNTAIGHASPTQMLDVNGNARFRLIASGTYSAPLNITSDGTLTTFTSDISMKKNIIPIDQALNKVLEMKGVYF